jgi:hypothetical protein
MLVVPCKDCQKRKVGCHSTCKEYKEFSVANEARREAIKREKEIDHFFKSNASRRLNEKMKKEKKKR